MKIKVKTCDGSFRLFSPKANQRTRYARCFSLKFCFLKITPPLFLFVARLGYADFSNPQNFTSNYPDFSNSLNFTSILYFSRQWEEVCGSGRKLVTLGKLWKLWKVGDSGCSWWQWEKLVTEALKVRERSSIDEIPLTATNFSPLSWTTPIVTNFPHCHQVPIIVTNFPPLSQISPLCHRPLPIVTKFFLLSTNFTIFKQLPQLFARLFKFQNVTPTWCSKFKLSY